MKVYDIKNNLKSALEKTTPDCYNNIKNGLNKEIILEENEVVKTKEKKTNNIRFNTKCAMAICACLLLFVVGIGIYYTPVNDIYLDVNPSVEIKTNLFDKVIVVNAKNDDGTSILNSIDIKNKNIEIAIDEIINEMILQGYIRKDLNDNAILISVSAKSEEISHKISDSINVTVNKKLTENNISAVVMNQELKSMKDLQVLSKETGISVGKLQLIQKMIQEDSNADISSLYDLKIKELLIYAKENNISIKKLVDKIDDVLDEDDEDDEDEEDNEDEDKNELKDKEKELVYKKQQLELKKKENKNSDKIKELEKEIKDIEKDLEDLEDDENDEDNGKKDKKDVDKENNKLKENQNESGKNNKDSENSKNEDKKQNDDDDEDDDEDEDDDNNEE